VELLKETGVALIQRDGENFEFLGSHSAWEVLDLEVRPEPGVWIRFKLGKRLR
jgi:hypothetical protein